jgi:hypothetical protein
MTPEAASALACTVVHHGASRQAQTPTWLAGLKRWDVEAAQPASLDCNKGWAASDAKENQSGKFIHLLCSAKGRMFKLKSV